METRSTTCLIAGGGPAGMMLGYLLARAGIDVTALEKHKDFLRDFRGDTVHPSTLEIMAELGLLDEFLTLPHAKVTQATADFGDRHMIIGDFSRVKTACKFIALMPQWDFLNFIAQKANALPNFHLLMETEAKDLIAQKDKKEGERIAGLLATTPDGQGGRKNIQIRAGLTVACDGRHSILREKSGLALRDLGAPFDVLWLRLPRLDADPGDVVGRVQEGAFFVMLPRGDYWQCAYLIPKGGFDAIKAAGITDMRARLRRIAGFAAGRVDVITGFDQIKLLTVAVNRLETWARPGLLCIGDAAHAMSPVGGVGINLAVQDAVAAANLLGPVLQKGIPRLRDLAKVQKRRQWPTKVIQAGQVVAQNAMLEPTLSGKRTPEPPLLVRLLNAWPWLRKYPAQVIGVGVRPEHVRLKAK